MGDRPQLVRKPSAGVKAEDVISEVHLRGPLPKFVTRERLAAIHDLTPRDRRLTAGALGALVGSPALGSSSAEAYYDALLELYGRGPAGYEDFNRILRSLGHKATKRSLHLQTFAMLLSLCDPGETERLRSEKSFHVVEDVFAKVAARVFSLEHAETLCWFAWTDWLMDGDPALIRLAMGRAPLAEVMAGWLPADEDQTETGLRENKIVAFDIGGANGEEVAADRAPDGPASDLSFDGLRALLDTAVRERSPGQLLELARMAQMLADVLQRDDQAVQAKALADLREVIDFAIAHTYSALSDSGRRAAAALASDAEVPAARGAEAVHKRAELMAIEEEFVVARDAAEADEWNDSLRAVTESARSRLRAALDDLRDCLLLIAGATSIDGQAVEGVSLRDTVVVEPTSCATDAGPTMDVAIEARDDLQPATEDAIDPAAEIVPVAREQEGGFDPSSEDAPTLQGAHEAGQAGDREVAREDEEPTLSVTRAEAVPEAENLVMTFLSRDELGLLELACRAGERLAYDVPPSSLAVLAGLCGRPGFQVEERYRQAVERWSEETSAALSSAAKESAFLAFAALVPGAVSHARSGARNALRLLKLEQAPEAVHQLFNAIVELGHYPSLSLLQPQSQRAEAQSRLDNAVSAFSKYCNEARRRKIEYQAATVVWEAIIGDKHVVAVAGCAADRTKELRELAEQALSWLQRPDQLVEKIDRGKRGGVAAHKPIQFGAHRALLDHIDNLRSHLAAIVSAADATVLSITSKTSERLGEGDNLLKLSRNAALALSAAPAAGGVAAGFTRLASRLLDAFADAIVAGQMVNPFAPAIDLDRYRLPIAARDPEQPDVVWAELEKAAAQPQLSWIDVFDVSINAYDHLASRAVLDLASKQSSGRDLIAEREDALRSARSKLDNQADSAKWGIDRAMNYAPAGETALGGLRAEVAAIDTASLPAEHVADFSERTGTLTDFPQAFDLLKRAFDAVKQVEGRALEDARERIEELSRKQPEEVIAHLNGMVERGDLITLMEELPLVERGQPLAMEPAAERALAVFRDKIQAAADVSSSARDRLRALALNRDDAASPRAVDIAKVWEELLALQPLDTPNLKLKAALSQLGFSVDSVGAMEGVKKPSGHTRIYRLRLSAPIADRSICAVARFGSQARGSYPIVLAEAKATTDEMVRAVQATGAPALLIVRGGVKVSDRIQLARFSRDRDVPFCLIDTELVLFVANRTNPLADVFACGVPFGSVSPYSVEPGSIPVEIFFGRSEELRSVQEPGGSNIVYGGRQLGKSVMLDHLATTYQRPGVIVRRVDCQAKVNQAADIWSVIADTLVEEGVKVDRPFGASTVRTAVVKWLDEQPNRRILMLLDETNEFVLRDAEEGSREIVEMRGLMEKTQRRFKVVLSGQHNVLRLAQNPNTPLAHFGDPIVIGPLRGTDLKAARGLVTEPLAAAGFVFEEPQLVSRVLAETQYYPKLVQLLCDRLLQYLRVRKADKRFDQLPPYKIDSADLEAVLRNADIRDSLFKTFKITIELDKRYELISLIFASNLYARREQRAAEVGFSVQNVLDEAVYYWPQGFPAGNKRDTVHALLDELVGLGVLIREVGTRFYSLASPIIGQMIGSQEEVDTRLLKFASEQPAATIDPDRRRNPLVLGASRSAMRPGPPSWTWLSPLAPGQISALLGTRARQKNAASSALVFGAPAMHLQFVIDALASTNKPELKVRDFGICHDRAQFARGIAGQQDEVGAIYVIRPETPWDGDWLREVERAKKKRTRYIFVGDGGHAWRCLVDRITVDLPNDVEQVTLAPLSAMEIEDHLRRNNINGDAVSIFECSGGFLSTFSDIAMADFPRAKERFEKSRIELSDYAIPNISSARNALAELLSYNLSKVTHKDLEVVDGVAPERFADWLLAVGLAEAEAAGDDGQQTLRLNPIFSHPSLRSSLRVD